MPYLKQMRMKEAFVHYDEDDEDRLHYKQAWTEPSSELVALNYTEKDAWKEKLWTYSTFKNDWYVKMHLNVGKSKYHGSFAF